MRGLSSAHPGIRVRPVAPAFDPERWLRLALACQPGRQYRIPDRRIYWPATIEVVAVPDGVFVPARIAGATPDLVPVEQMRDVDRQLSQGDVSFFIVPEVSGDAHRSGGFEVWRPRHMVGDYPCSRRRIRIVRYIGIN